VQTGNFRFQRLYKTHCRAVFKSESQALS